MKWLKIRNFNNWSIKSKLIFVFLGTSTIPLLLAFFIESLKDIHLLNSFIQEDIIVLGEIISSHSQAPLIFDDKKAADETLASLRINASVEMACLYKKNGSLLSHYSRHTLYEAPPFSQISKDKGVNISRQYYQLLSPVQVDNEVFGYIFIRTDRNRFYSTIELTIKISAIIIGCAFLLTLLLSSYLQNLISQPILHLVETVLSISNKKDYSIRAKKISNDEMGNLIDSFNFMLFEIQSRDEALEAYGAKLERDVENRTKELRMVNKELRKSKEKAEIANRAKSDFLASMSHEIRTPMNAIFGFTDLLKDMINDPLQKEYLKTIQASGKTLLSLINDVLDLSKIEAGKIEIQKNAMDLNALIKEIQQIFSLKVKEKDIEFKIHFDDKLAKYIILDEIRLRQVLINIVGNAIKFTENGFVKLNIEVTRKDEKAGTVDITFAVHDTGIGVQKEKINKIFEPFEQENNSVFVKYGGTGLGLTISNRLVRLMGGEDISVVSEQGKGSSFYAIFKNISFTDSISEKIDDIDIKKIIFEKTTLLIVDNHAENRMLVKGFLGNYDFHIIEANDGSQAIDITNLYNPDIILTDLQMPVMDGIEMTRYMKAHDTFKKIPIIVMTATVIKEHQKNIMDEGFDAIMTKPFNQHQLVKTFMQFLPHSNSNSKRNDMVQVTQNTKSPFVNTTDEDQISNGKALLDLIDQEFQQELKEIKERFFFREIETFAFKMKSVALSYQSNELYQWALTLYEQASQFNMEKLPKTLNQFSDVVQSIKMNIEK
ncbi:multi-sensor hybrid histidine kinase [Candidatus Magnetomorum sp. HK-1]|nr:multi-sensor hybrid histidine kinase [Candidatus Magnetomorum sp. HK-1]